jgi:hypothetical protein
MKAKIQIMIACTVIVAVFGLLAGCETTGSRTRDLSHDPYNVEGIEVEKG